MVEQAAHDSSDRCSSHLSLKSFVRVLELVDRINLSFIDENHKRSNRFSDTRYHKRGGGYSLNGKTAILRIVILGSSPSISTIAREAQSGRAEL